MNMHLYNFEFLSKNGFGTFQSYHRDICISAPSWSSILCGVYHTKHGIVDNSFQGKNYINYPMLPVMAKNIDPNLKFGMYMEWERFYNNSLSMEWDELRLGKMADTKKTVVESKDWLKNSDLDFYFIYFGAVDYWGHRLGFSKWNPCYKNALKDVDKGISELLSALKERQNYEDEDWLILFTTDHGGKGFTHGGYSNEERQVFWFAYSDRIKPKQFLAKDEGNINLINSFNMTSCSNPVHPDLAVTALHHLTIDAKCEWTDCFGSTTDGKSWLKEMGLMESKSTKEALTYRNN